MTFVPGKTLCTFCTNEIKPGERQVTIDLPIPPSLRKELMAVMEKEIPAPFRAMVPMEHAVPPTWKVEICVPCAYGLMPSARDAVSSEIKQMLERKIAARRRAEEQGVELEEGDRE